MQYLINIGKWRNSVLLCCTGQWRRTRRKERSFKKRRNFGSLWFYTNSDSIHSGSQNVHTYTIKLTADVQINTHSTPGVYYVSGEVIIFLRNACLCESLFSYVSWQWGEIWAPLSRQYWVNTWQGPCIAICRHVVIVHSLGFSQYTDWSTILPSQCSIFVLKSITKYILNGIIHNYFCKSWERKAEGRWRKYKKEVDESIKLKWLSHVFFVFCFGFFEYVRLGIEQQETVLLTHTTIPLETCYNYF